MINWWIYRFILKLTGLTDKWFYKLIKDGLFQRPIKLGRRSRWEAKRSRIMVTAAHYGFAANDTAPFN